MVGRGDGRLFHPSANPSVKIGITLTTSSPTLDPSSSLPFFLIVTARILTTPRPDSPVTLSTHLNPFGFLGNRSFHNIVCIYPETECEKRIEIWPRGWPQYKWDPNNLRDSWDFVTVPLDGTLEFKHQVDAAKIAEASVKSGERYQASFTDKTLGTKWWAFGSLEDFESVRLREWSKREKGEDEEKEEQEMEEEEGKEAAYDGEYLMGEVPDDLALVIEKGTVEFEIGQW